jgi:hypothetical protein
VLIAADDDAGAEVDAAGADVRAGAALELLPELHAAAIVKAMASASPGPALTAWTTPRETRCL